VRAFVHGGARARDLFSGVSAFQCEGARPVGFGGSIWSKIKGADAPPVTRQDRSHATQRPAPLAPKKRRTERKITGYPVRRFVVTCRAHGHSTPPVVAGSRTQPRATPDDEHAFRMAQFAFDAFDESRCSAIHRTYHSSLQSSSKLEPRDHLSDADVARTVFFRRRHLFYPSSSLSHLLPLLLAGRRGHSLTHASASPHRTTFRWGVDRALRRVQTELARMPEGGADLSATHI